VSASHAAADVRRAVIATLMLGAAAAAASTPLAEQTRQALAEVGSVDRLATVALRSSARDPATLRAQAELAIEAGDLDVALPLWRAVCTGPSQVDAPALRTWACLAELAGRDDEADLAWRAVIDHAASVAEATDGRLRLAMLRLDGGRPADARPLLDAVATADPAGAGLAAALFGQDDVAARALAAVKTAPVGLRLVAGGVALRAGKIGSARAAFEWVARRATDPRDRRFAAEQVLAAATRDGSVGDLTRQWLADPDLSPEWCSALAVALRESGRDADLLDWWRRGVRDPSRRDALRTEQVLAEVAAAARATGRADDVASVCDELLDGAGRSPRSVALAARLRLDQGDPAAADAVLDGEAAAAGTDGERLLRAGKAARSLGRDAAARRIADRLVRLGGTDGVRGLLLDASVCLRADERTEAEVSLGRAAAAARNNPDVAADVAAALDGAGLTGDAIELLRATAGTDDDRLLQLAGLLLQARRSTEATSVLDHLRRTTGSPGAAAQAGQRMLEIAGTDNGYNAMSAGLKGSIARGLGTAGDVLLLADVELAAHRPELAASLLRSTPLLDEPTRLRRLATLYLRTKEYGRADEVLRQLVRVDPTDAVSTLEQIAWVAVQRNSAADATGAIDEMASRTGEGPTAQELLGGLYDRLGFPNEAAGHYRRAIAGGGAGEDWLLWSTAMMKAGQPDVAGQRLQMLCVDDRTSNGTFVIAVDGLLGLDVPSAAVRAIRRAAVARAAGAPDGLPLLHIVGDLSDELADSPFGRRARAVIAAVSPDERSQVLRTLCEEAAADGDADGAVELGTSLLATGDAVPPQVFLDVGQRLLVAGRDAAAGRAFARAAGLSASDDDVAPRVAAVYENYGRFTDAERVLAPVAARHPRDPALATTVARELEILGRPHEAFSLYLRAANLTLTRGGGDAPRLLSALLATARTTEDRAAAVSMIRGHLDHVARVPNGSDVLAAERDAVRRISLAQGIGSQWPPPPATRPVVAMPGPTDLPYLIASGDDERARSVIRSTPASRPAEVGRTAPLLIAAAAALGDEPDVTRWSLRWLEVAGPGGSRAARPRVADVCRGVWGVLSTAGRRAVVDALLAIPHYGPTSADNPAVVAVRLAAAADIPVGDRPALAARLLDNPATAEDIAAELFSVTPASERPALLRLALARVAPGRRLSLLTTLVDRTTDPLDPATATAVVDAAAVVPPGQVVEPSDCFTNGSQRAVLPALADAVVRTGGPDGSDAPTTAGCAVAFSLAGDVGRADQAGLAAIDRALGSPGDDLATDVRSIQMAARALSDSARQALLQRLLAALGSDQPARQLTCVAALLRACGRPADALDLDRRNHAWHPTDDSAAAALAVSLASEGRQAELVDALGPRSGHAWGKPVRRLVAAALVSLGRGTEARQLDPQDVSAFAGATDRAAQSQRLRLALESARTAGTPIAVPADVGPDATDDLLATLRALPPGVSQLTTDVARAAAMAAVQDGDTTGRVLRDLTARSASGALLDVDAAVVRDLLAADPGLRLPPALVDALWARVRASGSDEAVATLAAALRWGGSAQAVGTAAWTAARERMGGGDEDGLPSPLEAVDDRPRAEALVALLGRGRAADAERAIALLRSQGRAGRHEPAIGMVWARLAAERGDLAAFRQRFEEALRASAWEPDAMPPEDVGLALPGHADGKGGVAVAMAAVATLEAAPQCPGRVQMLAVIGRWAADDGATAVAFDLLDRAARQAGSAGSGPRERTAVADLSLRLGDTRRADEIELALLRDRCLSADRIGGLLHRLRQTGFPDTGQLSEEAMRYCRWP
jgi:tetratricopeptide (TPR) repeat protein